MNKLNDISILAIPGLRFFRRSSSGSKPPPYAEPDIQTRFNSVCKATAAEGTQA